MSPTHCMTAHFVKALKQSFTEMREPSNKPTSTWGNSGNPYLPSANSSYFNGKRSMDSDRSDSSPALPMSRQYSNSSSTSSNH